MRFGKLILFCVIAWSMGCGDISVNHGITDPGPRTLAVASATLSSTAELNSAGDAIGVAKTGVTTFSAGCTFDGATDTVNTASSTVGDNNAGPGVIYNAPAPIDNFKAQIFSSSEYLSVTSTRLRLIRKESIGSSGDIQIKLTSTSGGEPLTTLASAPVFSVVSAPLNVPTADNNGVIASFTFPTAINILSSTDYAIMIDTDPGTTTLSYDDPPNDYVGWQTTNNTGCTGFADLLHSDDQGLTWSDANGAANNVGFFELEVEEFEASATVSWVIYGYSNATWDMSTFEFAEAPNSHGGTITYDIGFGSSAAEPTYTETALTETQVQALPDSVGTYIYIRANLSSGANQFEHAEIGSGTITVL